MMRAAIVIPTYNHGERIAEVIAGCRPLNLPILVVDDGSTDNTATVLRGITDITVLHHEYNQGKGAALLTGFGLAMQGCDWAITLDADGQHTPQDCLRLLEAVPEGQRPLVLGVRQGMEGRDVPWTSRFGRGFSNFWVWASGGPWVADSQSGFRLYPLPETLNLPVRAKRYQYEVEVLVQAAMAGMSIVEAPVQVIYQGSERVSHFRPFVDFWRNTITFFRLIMRRFFSRFFTP
ncbi:MAG: glycosyltransferase family 2 protein [Desulfobulbus sp.]|nr:MAG: glycosyltransferase family 2 protein [Desulfobulbus sp.]RUM40285.1 MAG: glycosyltransferase family 2 protein [Desulfobulbus sp.]